MSSHTNVAVMTGPSHRSELVAALSAWVEQREPIADFAMLPEGRFAADAQVIVGQIKRLYLDGGLESLLSVIRNAVQDEGYPTYSPTAVTLQDEEGEEYPWCYRLDSEGNWDPKP